MPDPELIEIATVEYVPPPIIEVTCNDGPMLLSIRQTLDGYNDSSAANAAAAAASAAAAANSETAAAASEAGVAADAATATASAAASLASQTAAATSEANSATSEANAATSETNAAASEAKAEDWATEAEDVEVVPGFFSAYHWAQKALSGGGGDALLDGDNVWTGSNDYEGAFSWQADADNTFVEFDIDHVTAGNSMPTFGIDWKRSGNRWWRLATNVAFSYNWAIQQYDRTDDSFMATRLEIGDQSTGPIKFRDASNKLQASIYGGGSDEGLVAHTDILNNNLDPMLVNKHRLAAYCGVNGTATPGTPIVVNDYGITSIAYAAGPYYIITLDESRSASQHMQFAYAFHNGLEPQRQWVFENAANQVVVVMSDSAGSWIDFHGTLMVWFVENS